MIDLQRFEQRQFFVECREHGHGMIGMYDIPRMRVKGDDHTFPRMFLCERCDAMQDHTVPEMYAVERADGEHCMRDRRYFINFPVYLHLRSQK